MNTNKLKIGFSIGVLLAIFTLSIVAGPDSSKKNSGGKGQGGGASVLPAVVPAYTFNLWLCRPGADTMTVSTCAWEPLEGYLSYAEKDQPLSARTAALKFLPGQPQNFVLNNLKANTAYVYQFVYSKEGKQFKDELRYFQTQRSVNQSFTFSIQADSHLDVSCDTGVYTQTLQNITQDHPDFLIDLGDTTMVDKFGRDFKKAESQYLAQRYYIGGIAHSVPVMMVLGNHDGEVGTQASGPDSMAQWSVAMRKKFFPCPVSQGIYSGNEKPHPTSGLLEDYYAWEWGDAQFIVLDPFWFTTEKGSDQWSATLGETQYKWLTTVLQKSKSKFRFVFIHHLVGGLNHEARGGTRFAPYMEWGGKNLDGSAGFAQHRPGWALPLHDLFVKYHVSVVFHGHDHLFAKEELDGIIYQECPQPSNPSGGTRSAEDYGYSGVILGSSGHLRVTVQSDQAKIDYIRCGVSGVTKSDAINGNTEYSYIIKPR
jgi:predicted phosphodiesterase